MDTKIKELICDTINQHVESKETNGINHITNKERIRKEFYSRISAMLKTKLNPKSIVISIISLAISTKTHRFNITNETLAVRKKMDFKVRKLITWQRIYHPRAYIRHLLTKKENAERELIQLELVYIYGAFNKFSDFFCTGI